MSGQRLASSARIFTSSGRSNGPTWGPRRFVRLGTVDGVVPWLRFTTEFTLLAALGLATLVLAAAVLAGDQRLRALIP
ncbi:hypothetical protein [Micromonospora foliorum]|uniref:hypothetical protein n=1 Tax=Micromonospora foliorum TaxID=2911210 RepID=UPI001EE7B412|nr:hypothetical protein [Micromonospora foliorum]MCG5440655.1 hypothetical protein [Micromonospora foliorum]